MTLCRFSFIARMCLYTHSFLRLLLRVLLHITHQNEYAMHACMCVWKERLSEANAVVNGWWSDGWWSDGLEIGCKAMVKRSSTPLVILLSLRPPCDDKTNLLSSGVLLALLSLGTLRPKLELVVTSLLGRVLHTSTPTASLWFYEIVIVSDLYRASARLSLRLSSQK